MSIIQNIENIYDNIKQIQNEEPEVAAILFEGLGISLDLLGQISAEGGRENIDISKQLQLITNVLGVSLEDLIKHSLQNNLGNDLQSNQENQFNSSKSPDDDILQYILSDIDNTPKNTSMDSPAVVKEQTIKFISSKKMDDYETFLAETSAKDNIDFLQKQI